MKYALPIIVILLAACAGPDPARMALTDQIDGDYQGKVRLIQGEPSVCLPSRYGVIEVGDRAIYLAYRPDILFTAPIAADGSIHAETTPYVLDGRIRNEHLSVTIAGAGCRSQIEMNFIWNHS